METLKYEVRGGLVVVLHRGLLVGAGGWGWQLVARGGAEWRQKWRQVVLMSASNKQGSSSRGKIDAGEGFGGCCWRCWWPEVVLEAA